MHIHAPTTKSQYAIRNTQYAIHVQPPIRNTQYAIRITHQGGSEWVRQHTIRNTQYAMRVKTGRLRLLQYAIRNTQYANPVKPHCVIRKMLPQYAIAQYAAYGVPHISRSGSGRGSGRGWKVTSKSSIVSGKTPPPSDPDRDLDPDPKATRPARRGEG